MVVNWIDLDRVLNNEDWIVFFWCDLVVYNKYYEVLIDVYYEVGVL